MVLMNQESKLMDRPSQMEVSCSASTEKVQIVPLCPSGPSLAVCVAT